MTTFALPEELSAAEPPEARGIARDHVRLLVASGEGEIRHTQFMNLPEFLKPGDLVVVNTSATLAAAVDGVRDDGQRVTVHFSADIGDGCWLVEVRPPGRATGPIADARPGERIALPDGASLVLQQAEPANRLWRVRLRVEGSATAYLARVGHPIRYSYVNRAWPIETYQTVFARDLGSAEMPSAARPFTDRLVTDLVTRGIPIAPITLHTGVSSFEAGEAPSAEWYSVSNATARLVNFTTLMGGRVIAVGTTVTRALETVADPKGHVRPGTGWTELVLNADRPARVVNGLITGWHAPGASHLKLLEAVAGRGLVARAYDAALAHGYLWHEFGDSCLLLP